MARDEEDRQRDDDDSVDRQGRPRLTPGEIWRLIFRGYRETLPYLIIFIVAILFVTWLITELVY